MTCAEGFAIHHIHRGETEVARDLLAFLESELNSRRFDDSNGQLSPTEELVARVKKHLEVGDVNSAKAVKLP
jgi:hypothetical protein